MDGFHAAVDLLEYDKLPVTIGPWKTSLLDAPLLASYYAVGGGLLLALDRLWPSDGDAADTKARNSSPGMVALSLGLLAAYLQLSSVMYDNQLPYSQIWAVLAPLGVLLWRLTDGSKQGLALALVSALVCPVAELILMRLAGVWHYPRADLFGADGITSWVACCYAFYTVVLGNVARLVASKFPEQDV